MPVSFGSDLTGRRIDIRPKGWNSDGRYELLIDGEVVTEAKPKDRKVELRHEDVEVKARLAWHEQSIIWAEVTVGDGESMPLDPEPGSRQAKLESYAERHPKLYAARHVVFGVGQVVIPILGVGLVLGLLPSISVPTPDVSLPAISIPFPDIDLPDLPDIPEPPGWVQAIFESLKFVTPVLIGIWLAHREYRRRREAGEKKRRAAPGEEPKP
jgi:hypothetical protein